MKRVDVGVIGAGPAGMAAAAEAACRGASVALVEECAHPGGKVLHTKGHPLPTTFIERHERRTAEKLHTGLRRNAERISLFLRHQVWHIQESRVLEISPTGGGPSRVKRIECKRIIIATGAVERVMPFPGWTLPGVFTLGGLNRFIKQGVLPGKRPVVAGSGPLLFVLAHNLIRAGVGIAALVQTADFRKMARHAFPLAAGMDAFKAFQTLSYLEEIIRKRVPVYSGAAVGKAEGNGRTESVRIIRLDAHGNPRPGTETDIPADILAVGYGLIPGFDLTRLCGCREIYDDRLGYWRTERDLRMESSVKGVFVAGDVGAVQGYEAAALEGRLAGGAAAAQLGYGPEDDPEAVAIRKALVKPNRFGRILGSLATPEPGLVHLITDDTPICRCEEVSMGDIRRAIAEGARDIHDIKRRTRTGMGQCQGRFCGQVINEVLWQFTSGHSDRERFTPRIPAKPCLLGDIVGDRF